ncbi:uncharacterized protein Z518_05677 [Rhinocladiella mackenziei CBS 650.93]|uniref:Cupin type-2 domain-containing protein n=1 Tax=Rhinocladiella mackenziei CBS 650.93 TaxID=1442369 RepID=A0A0D2INU8_9EURO|nr:uncharacterized protein Z518_05677 [Rhinocladiella mackenziei CBS 650.93]KIX04806.1 hypothetical protein Z518_05677 [Rhinocladiella mackenziei CBS 650.93]
MSSTTTTRRIVTGHSPSGRAIFDSDEILTSLNPVDGQPATGIIPGITTICKASGFPAKVNGPFIDFHGKKLSLVDKAGVICRVIDFPPIGDAEDQINTAHRTQSVDFAAVVDGEMQLTLDDATKTTLKKGDVVVQRGTMHTWRNVSNEYCKMLFVLIPSEKVLVPATGGVLSRRQCHSWIKRRAETVKSESQESEWAFR